MQLFRRQPPGRVEHVDLAGYQPGNIINAGDYWIAHVDNRFYKVPTYQDAVDVVGAKYSGWDELEISGGQLVNWGHRWLREVTGRRRVEKRSS